ncbi:tyrosine aminotransferase [Tremella mesenterica]|uniref:Tyrosine aminotransferase n=1 Tax=Tremella mesenterica TaxID=5217 RepID=A0A4Q1BHN9_TREME|nr:tyrosine aminotransferase [Tremella mesenterica]
MPNIDLLDTAQVSSVVKRHKLVGMIGKEKKWDIGVSPSVPNSRNPIRTTLELITSQPPNPINGPTRSLINLGLGDPTHYPLHPPPEGAIDAITRALKSGKANGYLPGAGSLQARSAVVDYHERWDGVTHGVGQGLDLILSVLIPHQTVQKCNVLLPRPGFAQYATLLANLGTDVRYYDLLEEQGWEIDLSSLEDSIDGGTKAIILTNPSNPCGSNYSRSHLQALLDIAEQHKVPIISDEIYGHMTWDKPFVPLASLSRSVPIITLAGLSKRFLVPGWRFGWVCLHDPLCLATKVREGMHVWANRFMGPNSLVQAALPDILATPGSWFKVVMDKIQLNAHILTTAINTIPGLSCAAPSGALYMLVKIDSSRLHMSDIDFCTSLYREEALFVLPGICFEAPGYFRAVLSTPADVMQDVALRLRAFCHRHGGKVCI